MFISGFMKFQNRDDMLIFLLNSVKKFSQGMIGNQYGLTWKSHKNA